MVKNFSNVIGKEILVEVSGGIEHLGILIDFGQDLIVMYNGKDYIYIPLIHIQKLMRVEDEYIEQPNSPPINDFMNEDSSLRKVLNNAKGQFTEIYVTKNQSFHGHITNIMNDYFVFYSPVYKTMYVSLQHLKWIIPYSPNQTPYNLEQHLLPLNPSEYSLSRTFEDQIKKFIGKVIVIDIGRDQSKIGKLNSINDKICTIINGRGAYAHINLRHVKTIHLP